VTTVDPLLTDALSDRYLIERELGRGGMATVYLAQDCRHHRLVAIKVLHPELARAVGSERFLHEIEIIAQLQHPHILPLHDSGEAGGLPYFVMPYVAGESLRNRLTRERQLPLDESLEIARQVASALAYAHSHGVVHRDIKPENILLTEDQAIVADFGIAWAVGQSGGERLTGTGLTLGTPAYMSPEQAAGERHLDGRSDIYSLACIVYEMLAGEPPFTGPTAQTVIAKRFGGPPPPLHVIREGVPEAVERAIDHALAKAPADRFKNALQFSTALSAPSGPLSRPASDPHVQRRRRQRRLLRLVLTGVGVAGAAALGTLLFHQTDPRPLDANLIAVAPFDVFHPELGLWREGLVDILSRGLDGAGTLRAVSPRVAIRRWSGRAEPAEAKALGRRTGAQLVVFGQMVGSGPDSVRLTATLLDVGADRRLGEVDLRDASAHMDRLVDSTAVALLRVLGRHRPVGAVRQAGFGGTSLPALKEFLRGEQFYRRSAWDSALAHYDAAIALDSTFALAYRRMQLSLGWSPPTAHSFQSPQAYAFRAAAFNRRLPTRDSLLIVMDSLGWGLGWDDTAYFAHRRRAFAAADEVARLNPNDPEVWNALGEARHHNATPAESTQEEILATLARAIQLDPEYGPAYEHTVLLAIRLGRLDLARQYAGAYIDLVAADINSQQFRLEALLLDPTLAASTEAARLIDTSAAAPLAQAVLDLSAWADSGETVLRLARSLASGTHSLAGAPSWLTDTVRKEMLAAVLAFRGHFREARAALPGSPISGNPLTNPVLDLAVLGAVPPDSARIVVPTLVAGDSLWPPAGHRYALPWWYTDRDTAALKRFEIQVVAAARRYPNPVAKAYLRNLAEVARAYLVLARGDSTEGLRMLGALPDSLCALSNCFFEKFTLAELAAARGQDREAAAIYDRWLRARDWSPLFVIGRLNRARLAERLGERDHAAGLYQYVLDAWRLADPELRPHVAAARDGLERLAGEPRE
jgi:eukaryotic-like serine/threonine-protein kinase